MKKKKSKSKLSVKLPEIKKDIAAFLTSEEGKVTKKEIVAGAVTLAMLGIATDAVAGHTNTGFDASYLHNNVGIGQHYSHSNHASHGSHNSW